MKNEIYQGTVYKAIILALVIVPFLSVLAAVILLWNNYVFLNDIILLIVLYMFTMLGETVGYHRMLTHQAFSAPHWLRCIFLIAGAMSFTGGPMAWTATHLKHHAHSDEEEDPHTPLKGFWYAHLGWLFNHNNFLTPNDNYASRLLKDPAALFVHRTRFIWLIMSLLIPFIIGGWTGLIWGGGVRIFLVTHATWSVNSICHTFGQRAFETKDISRNNWFVGLLAFGEGWHNNHHAFPRSAFHGLRWWQFDLSGFLIHLLEKVGLAWDVQRVNQEAISTYHERTTRLKESLSALHKQLTDALDNARQEGHQLLKNTKSPKLLKSGEAIVHRLDQIQKNVAEMPFLKKQYLQDLNKEVIMLTKQVRTLQGVGV